MPYLKQAFFYNAVFVYGKRTIPSPIPLESGGNDMNLLIGLLKTMAFVSIAVVLAVLSTLAAVFGGSFIPSRWSLPTSGSPREDLWTDQEREQRLQGKRQP